MPKDRPKRTRARRYLQGPHIFERDGRWWAYLPPLRSGERPVRRSLATSDRRAAERALAELVAGRRDPGSPASEAPREDSLANIVEQYLNAPHGWTARSASSIEARATAWLDWCAAHGITHPSQIKGEDAQRWVADRLALPCKHATINRDLGVIQRMLRWAAHTDRGLCVETPFARLPWLREDRRERAPLIPSPREVQLVVRTIEARYAERPTVRRGPSKPSKPRTRHDKYNLGPEARLAALYIACSLGTGVRISELAGAREEQLHVGAWIVPPSKGHAERTLPLSPESEQALRELVAINRTVMARNGRPLNISERWALDLLDWACPLAGVPAFDPHDLRRTFATECRRAGLPVTLIRDLMGHKDTQTTERYFGRYREDAAAQVPVPAALRDLVAPRAANVLPLRR